MKNNFRLVGEHTYNDLGNVNVYIGSDGKIHYTNRDGADSALPFNKSDSFSGYLQSSNYISYELVSDKSNFSNTLTVRASSNLSRNVLANIYGKGFTKIYGNFDYPYYNVIFIKDDGTCEHKTFGKSIDIPNGTVYIIYGFLNSNDYNNYTIRFS